MEEEWRRRRKTRGRRQRRPSKDERRPFFLLFQHRIFIHFSGSEDSSWSTYSNLLWMRGQSRGLSFDWLWNHITVLSLIRIARSRISLSDVAAILFEAPVFKQNLRPRVEGSGQPFILK
jgi:hypothetical protein